MFKDLLVVFGGLILLIGVALGICAWESAIDEESWNNGICSCGGEFEFSNAAHRKNGGNYYYYVCNECSYVIETYNQMTK